MHLAPWRPLAGPLVALSAIGGLWWSAERAERTVQDRAAAALARNAVAYLSVVTPAGSAGGYDPARLLSAAHNLANASFWPGGLQIALGAVPLLPDTIGLLPAPDSLLQALDSGAHAVVAVHGTQRAVLVPFLDRDRWGMLGWAATWRTVQPRIPSMHAIGLTAIAAGWLVLAVLLFRRERDWRWRGIAAAIGTGFIAVLALDLGWSVGQTARTATESRLLTVKRLVEIAATAPGVRQAMLPEVAVGFRVRPMTPGTSVSDDIVRGEDDRGAFVAVTAASPRNQTGLVLSAPPLAERLGRLNAALLAWVLVAAIGLAVSAWGRPTTASHSVAR